MRNCILEAYRLKLANKGKGKVCYVASIENQTVGHAYYVPDPENLEAKALNHADNGFSQYPVLSVKEVLENYDPRYLSITSD